MLIQRVPSLFDTLVLDANVIIFSPNLSNLIPKKDINKVNKLSFHHFDSIRENFSSYNSISLILLFVSGMLFLHSLAKKRIISHLQIHIEGVNRSATIHFFARNDRIGSPPSQAFSLARVLITVSNHLVKR